MKKRTARQKAIIRRRIFLTFCSIALVLVIGIIAFTVKSLLTDKDNGDSNKPSSSQGESNNEEPTPEPEPEPEPQVDTTSPLIDGKLNPDFRMLLLVNGDNPLPDDYDTEIRKDLVTVDKQYRNNNYVTDIHKDVYPYITAMVAAAQKDGVDLRVWSPFRSYAIQKDLFLKQVKRMEAKGYKGQEAENQAATVVARPGTSEHNTGLCADFNMASDAFENTKMYTWMKEHAEDYGFVMRYSKEKQSITGVIHESWHWRFVGINAAKEMNDLNMCLEEYVKHIEK